MRDFMGSDFLLTTNTARRLFNDYAKEMPIFDYHCHLSAREIWENNPFDNLGRLWLEHDHYKWRVMRAAGVPERLVTGKSSWYEKFMAFATILHQSIGNPVYHWSHLELQRYFQIHEPLDALNAKKVWNKSLEILSDGLFSPRSLIEISNVKNLCTTEDPADTLEYHHKLSGSGWTVKVFPAWRPDNVIKIEQNEFEVYIKRLSAVSDVDIKDFDSLYSALLRRMDDFERAGCIASDHDVTELGGNFLSCEEMESLFQRRIEGFELNAEAIRDWKTTLMFIFAKQYAKRGWAMEMHIGCNRNSNSRGVKEVGEACGFDSVGDSQVAKPIGSFLDHIESTGQLPKTVLFCLNPKDNWVLAALANTFQEDSIPGKIQFGTAWWFQDHIPGMQMQLETYATSGVLGNFIGMLSDSRSFLSYPRFEYFRRILCSFIGDLVESGQYPNNNRYLEPIVRGICYENAERFFFG